MNTQRYNSYALSNIAIAKPAQVSVIAQSDIPQMNYDSNKNIMFIKGASSGDLVAPFYQGAVDVIHDHFENADNLHLYLYLNDINAQTVKSLFGIFKSLQDQKKAGNEVKVTWFFDLNDLKMMENGNDFSDLFQIKFTIVPV